MAGGRDKDSTTNEAVPPGADDRQFGPVTVLSGERGGRYPDGNSLLVRGADATAIIDPAVGLWRRRDALPEVDLILNSHCHEDHVAGNPLFPGATCHLHEADAMGLGGLDAMMEIYGFTGAVAQAFRKVLVDEFHYETREDVDAFDEGDVFELGGVDIEVLHTPGHTRGHSCFQIHWLEGEHERSVLYLGDIELTSFGPYYGDAWSNLDDFERSLARVRTLDADWYATFHHIGVLESREAFLERLDVFEAKIEDREQRLLAFLTEPRSMDDIVAHRFVYRPGDVVSWAEFTEARSAEQHIARWLERGVVREVSPGRWLRAGA